MEKEYYHQSIKFDKNEAAYIKLLELQHTLLDPIGKKYPLTSIIKMSIMNFESTSQEKGK